ncbi:MAG: class I SAM-dependent methyltransferase, partial [Bacteroidia bacterium]|nr:class I SAM-dependent methyltransferase [Bacteroidia bacterium]
TKDWYTSWFNTPYYHILYRDRGYDEAQSFLSKLLNHLNLSEDSHILDLACGKGRHSLYLNRMGYEVTGLDLSEESINYAKQYENDRLHFAVHDKSKPYHQQFDAIFNLFTSFGYFENEDDHLNTIKSIKANLKDKGVGVIDFMNSHNVIQNLVSQDEKTIDDIVFKMSRYVKDDYIIKDINFEIDKETFNYQERVKAFTLDDFKSMFDAADLQLIEVFGDYKLTAYDENSSERLIMIFM